MKHLNILFYKTITKMCIIAKLVRTTKVKMLVFKQLNYRYIMVHTHLSEHV